MLVFNLKHGVVFAHRETSWDGQRSRKGEGKRERAPRQSLAQKDARILPVYFFLSSIYILKYIFNSNTMWHHLLLLVPFIVAENPCTAIFSFGGGLLNSSSNNFWDPTNFDIVKGISIIECKTDYEHILFKEKNDNAKN